MTPAPDDLPALRLALAEAQRAAQDATAAERRLVEAQRISQVGSYDFELATNTNRWSEQLFRIYGQEPRAESVSYEDFLALVHPDDRARVVAVHQRALATLAPYEMEERIRWPDGQVRTLASWGEVLSDDTGAPVRMVGICWDITERKAMEAELANQALHDRLTGLANRALLRDRVGQSLAGLGRSGGHVAILFVDIDRFKVINESLGHGIGDEVLVEVAARLAATVHPQDTVARFGGDEFVVLSQRLNSPEQAAELAEELQRAVSRPIILAGTEIVVTVSTGIALTDCASSQAGELLRDADAAMYRAKEDGRARSVFFVEAMRARAVDRLDTENQLRQAIQHGQLRVHYQPVVDLATSALLGFEALVRWLHPTRGLIRPAEFIPVAEETGLVVPLGEWVLQEACAQLVRWSTRYPGCASLTMAVNLSGVQIHQPGFVERVGDIMTRTGVTPSALELEITESVLMRDVGASMGVLRGLKDLGLRLSVDDFGTGYSSLSYLKRFPVDTLKVDRSFVDGLAEDADDAAIVSAVLALASALGMTTVAEGIETREQLDVLCGLGCARGQGYFFSHPLTAAEITPLLSSQVPAPRSPLRAAAPAARTVAS